MFTRQNQQPVGLGRIDVLGEKERRITGLLFGEAAETTLAGLHGFGIGQIANAPAHVGETEGCA